MTKPVRPDRPDRPGATETWGLDIMTRVLATGRKLDDDVLYDDADLLKHIDGSEPFDVDEWRAVLASPLTLRRLDVLAEAHAAQQAACMAPQAPLGSTPVADAVQAGAALVQGVSQRLRHTLADWFTPSTGQWAGAHVRDRGALTITTGDERWKLAVLPAATVGARPRIVLQLNPDDEWARKWQDDIQVQVVDHLGQVLLQGGLNEDNELSGNWPLEAEPGPYLAARGASITVRPTQAG